MSLVHSALHDRHVALGAKLAPFAGWEMPLEYAGTVAEHHAVRNAVGVFDVSHLGTVVLEGPDSQAVIAATFTNDPSVLDDGRSQYTLCANAAGGITDDCIVYRLAADHWLVIPNAANVAAVVAQLRSAADGRSAALDDGSMDHAVIAIQGPRSFEVAMQATGVDASTMPFQAVTAIRSGQVAGYLCRTGYTGERGVEVVVPNDGAGQIWDAAVAARAQPCGLGARDTLRLEMGYPLHGNDLDATTSPWEARLGWAVKLDRDDFVGRAALVAAKAVGPSRRLLGVRGEGRRPLRPGMPVLRDGVVVGLLCSGGFSPTLETGIGLGYLADPVAPGDVVTVDIRGRDVPAEVVRPPFVAANPHG